MVGSLLQNRLKSLFLTTMQLEDSHFIVIAQMLSRSPIGWLDLSVNKIGVQGILEFTRQRRWTISLRSNPWERSGEGRGECCTALLQGMIKSYSIEYLGMSCPQAPLVYLTNLNRS